jgi:hypothetical protein
VSERREYRAPGTAAFRLPTGKFAAWAEREKIGEFATLVEAEIAAARAVRHKKRGRKP